MELLLLTKGNQSCQLWRFCRIGISFLISSSTYFKSLRALNMSPLADHVYFVHPSTDISVDISVDISTDTQQMYRSTYWPSIMEYVGRHIGRHSADMSTEMCRSTYRPMYQPRYRPSDGRHIDRRTIGRYLGRYSGTRPIRWPLIVGWISVDRRWYIGQKLRLLVYKILSPLHNEWKRSW